jgi:hypothetical protein
VLADDSTIFDQQGSPEPYTIFFVPVAKWSDSNPDTAPH